MQRDAAVRTQDMRLLDAHGLDVLVPDSVARYRLRLERLRPGLFRDAETDAALLCRLGAAGVGADGALQLGGICLVAGLGGATRRDGSLAYYFSEPIVENDAKGVGPLLLAYTEILAAQKQ